MVIYVVVQALKEALQRLTAYFQTSVPRRGAPQARRDAPLTVGTGSFDCAQDRLREGVESPFDSAPLPFTAFRAGSYALLRLHSERAAQWRQAERGKMPRLDHSPRRELLPKENL